MARIPESYGAFMARLCAAQGYTQRIGLAFVNIVRAKLTAWAYFNGDVPPQTLAEIADLPSFLLEDPHADVFVVASHVHGGKAALEFAMRLLA